MSANNPSKSFTTSAPEQRWPRQKHCVRALQPAPPHAGKCAAGRRMEQGPAWSQLPRSLGPWTALQSSLQSLSKFTACQKFPLLATAAQRLLSTHVTTAAAERIWSAWWRTLTDLCNNLSIETVEKLIYVKANMPSEWLK